MKLVDLIGCQVVFGVSEPWEFGLDYSQDQFFASVISVSQDSILLKLPKPMRYRETDFEHLVAMARHTDKNLSQMTNTVAIPVNLIPIQLGLVKEDKPEAFFNAAASWRQWHLVGGLRKNAK